MKIAMCEWYPRLCGSTEYGVHFANVKGVDLLTFSKSGRPLKAHAWPGTWRTVKLADAVRVLNEYDLVFAIDIVCFAPQLAGRKMITPYYVDLLEKIDVPWTAMYHGGLYSSKYDPILERLLASKTFTGTLVTTRLAQAQERLGKFGIPIRYVNHPFLPFDREAFAARVPRPKKRAREFLMTSRIAVNKGQNAALALTPKLRGNVNLWGYNAFGLPSIGWRLWELGQALGYRTVREAELRDDARQLTHPRAKRFYTGRFEFAAGRRRVRYHDEYPTVADIDWSPWVHLALTSTDFGGSLEYCTLNGIAAGCVAAVPEHAVAYTRRAYDGYALPTFPYTRCNLWSASADPTEGVKGTIHGGTIDQIAEVLNRQLGASDEELANTAKAQYQALVDLHDPQKIARKIFRDVFR